MQYSPRNKHFSGADNLDLIWIFAVGLGAAVLLSASTATSAVQVISA
jgi:hypothetical protein